MAPSTLAALAEKRTLVEKSVCDEDEHPTVAYNQFSNPVISLARIDEFDGTRGETCRKIVEACEEWGIFQVVDHGVDRKMIGEMYRLAREFFILPAEKQLRYDMTGGKKGGFLVSSHLQYLSNGRFNSADHQAVVNSNYSRLSVTTFQHPAPEAIVYPLQIQEGEKPVLDEPITFTEMYRRKMNRDIELARLKKMAKDQQSDDLDQAKLEYKPIGKLLA